MRRLFFLLYGLAFLGLASAAAQAQLRLARLDFSDFPLVRLNLITADSQSAPITDLSTFSLRENGIPIADFEATAVPVGMDAIFVIDANSSLQQVDGDDGLTRQEKVRQSITRFANQFMSPEGLDRVAIVVPDGSGENGRFLIEDAATPGAVIAAMDSYNPDALAQTPLNEMMILALAHAADRADDGRFQSILLFSDSAQIGRQLNFSALVQPAQNINLPIFTAILGARADDNEIANAALLYQPTRAAYVHMPEATGTDPIYAIWQAQSQQTQIQYRSLQTSSGRYPITINLGSTRVVAEMDLTIAPPQVGFQFEATTIRRLGDAPDSPLASLQPTTVTVPVVVVWPDGRPRRLTAVTLFINGQPQPPLASMTPDADGLLTFDWDVTNLDAGVYTLLVQIQDDLGYGVESEALPVTIGVERPLPPTPTTEPTSAPETADSAPVQARPDFQNWLPIALAVVAIFALLALLLRRRRTRVDEDEKDVVVEEVVEETAVPKPPAPPDSEPLAPVPVIAFFELLEDAPGHVTRIRIEGEDVTIGRDHDVAQIIFADQSVSLLHARIKKRDGEYWLYDEGSANGTSHNFERLGLTPQQLQNGDRIHLGRVGLRFCLAQQLGESDI